MLPSFFYQSFQMLTSPHRELDSADLLGETETLGSLEVGKAVDIVAVKGKPLEDISLLENMSFVMKAGEVIKSI